jgi:hypothetical protein
MRNSRTLNTMYAFAGKVAGSRYAIRLVLASVIAARLAVPAVADVIVLANRTGRELPIRFTPLKGRAQQTSLRIGENRPMYCDGRANIDFSSPGGPKKYLCDANAAYFFANAGGGRIDMQKIGLREDGTLAEGRDLPGSATSAPPATITVKILVDEEEPARRNIWEERLRRRVEAASAVFERDFRTKFQVVAVDTWKSDNANNDFYAALAEFERSAKPAPARLAIGFTSQWKMERGRMHMAGTRGPLSTHVLVREGNPQIDEPERLEFLIHELGHFLGAAHSPERDSVMRPVLGDNQAGRSNYRIHFDPINTLTMAIIGEEMRRRNLTKLAELSPDTRKRLVQIYTELGRAIPDDPAPAIFAQLVRSESGSPLVTAAREVLKQITRAAINNRSLPPASLGGTAQKTRREGDALTEYLVSEAARAAQAQPEKVRAEAFILAIVLGLSEGEAAASTPTAANSTRIVESPSERGLRLKFLGEPTILGRRDLARHFFGSALLAATTSAEAAKLAALAKELSDAQGPRGFSFVDLAVDRAGIRFARSVIEKRVSLGALALSFKVTSFVPDAKELMEKVSDKEFAAQFGTKDDPRFIRQLKTIDDRISALPGYRPMSMLLTK